ncbi:MAG: hypothetical protein ACK4GN_13385 [Runella sp.]
MFLGITQVLKNNFRDIKESAEQALASGKTSCWLCWVVNAIVTVVVVAVVVAAVVVTGGAAGIVITGGVLTAAVAGSLAIAGGAIGVLAGIVFALTDNCFVVVDYGQMIGPPADFFGILLHHC